MTVGDLINITNDMNRQMLDSINQIIDTVSRGESDAALEMLKNFKRKHISPRDVVWWKVEGYINKKEV